MKGKFNYKIGGIVAIAVIATIAGTLTITSFQTNSDSQTQSIGLGAYVTVEAYHEDGTLFQEWKGHNDLSPVLRNALVSCITGFDTAPAGFDKCNFNINGMSILIQTENGEITRNNEVAQVNLTPENCDTDFLPLEEDFCTGWTMKSTFDFDQLSCTPTVDCYNVVGISAQNSVNFKRINDITLSPDILIIPNDRLVVTMDFEIPP